MGRPKPLLDFDGRSCLSLILSACFASQASETVLVLGADAPAVREEALAAGSGAAAASRGLRVVMNEQFDRGQTSSFKAGLDAVSGRADALVMMPVDLPLITAAEIDAVMTRHAELRRGRTIFIAAHEGRRGHPVLFSAVHRARLLELADSEPVSDYIRMHEGETELVSVENRGILLPLNTPEEYQEVLARYRAGRPA